MCPTSDGAVCIQTHLFLLSGLLPSITLLSKQSFLKIQRVSIHDSSLLSLSCSFFSRKCQTACLMISCMSVFQNCHPNTIMSRLGSQPFSKPTMKVLVSCLEHLPQSKILETLFKNPITTPDDLLLEFLTLRPPISRVSVPGSPQSPENFCSCRVQRVRCS
jgi:hypothetical protein